MCIRDSSCSLRARGLGPALHAAAARGRRPPRRGALSVSEVVVRPFSDVHLKGRTVVATLLHDPTVEGLDVALYMDGSASMEDEYGPRGILAKLGPVKNQVEPQMQWMLEYLATKDRDGVLRVAY